jgi:hypothetical protein
VNSTERAAWRRIAADEDLDQALEEAETAALHEWAETPPEPRVITRDRAPTAVEPGAHCLTVPDGETAFNLSPTHLVLAVSLSVDEATKLLAAWREFAATPVWDERTEQLFVPLFELLCLLLDQVDPSS